MSELTTADEVIDALGGNGAVIALTGCTPSSVSNWRRFGRFPADEYVRFQAALTQLGHHAPPSLWRQSTSEQQEIPEQERAS